MVVEIMAEFDKLYKASEGEETEGNGTIKPDGDSPLPVVGDSAEIVAEAESQNSV